MIDPELKTKLDEIEAKVDAAYKAAHKAQQYLFWTGVITLALFILPLIGLIFVIPFFLNSYLGSFQPYLNTTPTSQSAAQTGSQSELNTLQQLGL